MTSIQPILISPEKTGYVEGNKILDGIILDQESIWSLKTLKTPSILIKMDLSKDFEKLNLDYMESILLNFCFNYH